MPNDTSVGDAAHNAALWEQHAAWWQQTFTGGVDPEYEDQILPLVARHVAGARRVLDIGCGEGQVARHLAGLGAEVTGVDPAPSQVHEARRRGEGPRYVQARAEALPWRARSFDAVVACLAFEHVDAIDVAVQEVARVLEPDGRFVLLVGHPLLQAPRSGWVEDHTTGEHYWRIGGYLREHVEVDEVAPGIHLRFIHRPLGRYVHALGAAGLLVDDMDEPPPPPALVEELWPFPEASTIPRFIAIRAGLHRKAKCS